MIGVDDSKVLHEVTRQEFFTTRIGAASRANTDVTTEFDVEHNRTRWYLGSEVFGESEGPLGTQQRYWLTARWQAFESRICRPTGG